MGAVRCALACSSYEGSRRIDATVDAPPGAPDVEGSDGAGEAARTFVWCGADFVACHPLTNAGCAAGQRCVVEQLRPPVARCMVAATRPEGALCGEGFGPCGEGLQCLTNRCLRPCCFDGAASACGERSACAVLTEATFIRGCTLRGACDYPTGEGCPADADCAPTTPLGEARCLAHGDAGPGRNCVHPNDCVAGHTCRARAGGEAYCARVCNPEASEPPRCRCVTFFDRPANYGVCP